MKIRIPISVRMAIRFMLGLTVADQHGHPELQKADWCNFGINFFSDIEWTGVEQGGWEPYEEGLLRTLERTVKFYFRGQLVAEILMRGQERQLPPAGKESMNFWEVDSIKYAKNWEEKPTDWVQGSVTSGLTYIRLVTK